MKLMTLRELEELAARQRMEMYWEAHPGGPSAVRQPRLFKRGRCWIVLLGPNLRDGMAGFGSTVETALRAFDRNYLDALRPPKNSGNGIRNPRKASFCRG